MTNGFPDRLSQLRLRWQSDPSSRIFLQLAEEYRHLGRVREALEVLDSGLKEHPGYLSALVAKGRCLLELGEAPAARTVLERVVQQDATQMVANKLLVRAYIETGDADRARHRIDLYTLLTERDPEIEELAKRVAAMSPSPQAADEPLLGETAERPRMASSPPSDEPQPPAPSAASRPTRTEGEVFDLGASPERRPTSGEVFRLESPAAPPPEAVAQPVPAAEPVESEPAVLTRAASPGPREEPARPVSAAVAAPSNGHGTEPFPGLDSPASRTRYLDGLAAEGIFFRERLARAAAPVAASGSPPVEEAPRVVASSPPEEPAAANLPTASLPAIEASPEEPLFAEPPRVIEPILAARPAGAAGVSAAAPSAPVEPVAAPAEPGPAEEQATATLGFLYLDQGHVAEAERIFGEVLQREPGNGVVRGALKEIAQRREPLNAARLLTGFEPGHPSNVVAKKTYMLGRYLRRLRSSSQHVS